MGPIQYIEDLGPNDVKTRMNFLDDHEPESRRYVCRGGALSTGDWHFEDVIVRDARPFQGEYKLENKGFELNTWPATQVSRRSSSFIYSSPSSVQTDLASINAVV
jgi:hypothetical protein